ncbi:TAXI family TRAP transporter solute-binding subunit [Halalkalibacter krulwichiae]|uniref:Alkanesulfonate transporter substrate-binding subunit n=1 Tax=Halalkalibacter krulwichiae TaxID=199441 RepID=A0A1X9MIA2_9BACI|nr:TAXI family TRAP transporter solute-binding subunit [Halalkalibacter krulwichiae]ARK31963.1 alkanesulfonate transporter substrate-binding subunit [Halalkalibacter krulwichiae]
MKKLSFLMMLALMLVLAACGGAEDPADPADDGADTGEEAEGGETTREFTDIAIMTGGEQGTYFPLGAALANNIINAHVENVDAASFASGASVVNINGLVDGDADIALVQNDVAYYASEGLHMFEEDGALEGFQGIATLYPEVVQIITAADSGIATVEDLVGKRVAVGDLGSGAEINARQILEIHDITYDDINEEYMGFGDAANGIQDGNIDAAFITAGLPTGAVEALKASKDINVVEISSDKVAELADAYPYYTEFTIPGDTYGTEDTTTAAVLAMLAVSTDMDEDLVYDITKAMFENTEAFSNAHQQGTNITLDTALDGMSIEVHPGAQRFFDEQ